MADPDDDSRPREEPAARSVSGRADPPLGEDRPATESADRDRSADDRQSADQDRPADTRDPANRDRSADGPERRRLRALAVAAGLSVVGPAVAGSLVVLAGAIIREAGTSLPIVGATVLSVVLTTGLGLGGVALLYLRRRPHLLAVRVPSLRDWLATLVGVGLMFGLVIPAALAIQYLRRFIGVEPAQNNVAVVAGDDPEVLLVLIPLALLVIGPGEELLFRGAVQGRLREVFGAPAAIGIASTLFAAIHFGALVVPAPGRVLTILILFIPAAVLGAAYEYSGNLVVPSLMHGAYDAILFGLLYLALRLDLPTEGGQGLEAVVVGLLA